MNIQRIRRQSVRDEWPQCDYCDEATEVGYQFTGENVYSSLTVCDKCLTKTRQSDIGFYTLTKGDDHGR